MAVGLVASPSAGRGWRRTFVEHALNALADCLSRRLPTEPAGALVLSVALRRAYASRETIMRRLLRLIVLRVLIEASLCGGVLSHWR